MFPFLLVALIVACSAETGAPPRPTAAVSVSATAPVAGQTGDGVLLIWHRSGGIAGFCDVLVASTGGEVQAGTCNAEPRVLRLTDAERLQLQTWAARYGRVVIAIGDPAVADALFTSLEMDGLGTAQPTESEQQQMLDWAQVVYERTMTP
ncbi:MAG: hypothetical protein NZM11_05135 [Anaerolineales bacterium]|nr:hypothetical protein [Anaerolineales bacterium]